MFKVAVDGRGRFGNNLIQYFACKIFCNYFTSHNYVVNKNELMNPIIINETQLDRCIKNNTIKSLNRDIFLEGFFQDIYFLSNHRDYIKSLFVLDNNDVMNYHHYEKKMIVKDLIIPIDDKEIPHTNDLVMHIRLDDFIHQGHNSNILDVNYYVNVVINNYFVNHWNTIWIVVDKLRNEFDKKYIDVLIKKLEDNNITNIKLRQKSFLEDWTFCIKSTNFISSNSTFALTAILLSEMKYVILPNEFGWKNITPIDKIDSCIFIDVKRINKL